MKASNSSIDSGRGSAFSLGVGAVGSGAVVAVVAAGAGEELAEG